MLFYRRVEVQRQGLYGGSDTTGQKSAAPRLGGRRRSRSTSCIRSNPISGSANNAREQQHIIFDPIPRVGGIEASAAPFEPRANIYQMSGSRRRSAGAHQTLLHWACGDLILTIDGMTD
jgi:hypothetical protein